MCFSLAGRLQTRLVSLAVPAFIGGILIALTGDQRYFAMFLVVAVVAVDLDVLVYSRLFRYQARWQTYGLGLIEFPLYLAIVYGLGGTLPPAVVVAYYVAGWLGGLLAVNVVLPVVDESWAEHGGELARGRLPLPSPHALALAALAIFTGLELTLIPGNLTPEQVLTALAVAAVLGALLRVGGLADLTLVESLVYGLMVALLLRGQGIWPFAAAAAIAVMVRSLIRLGQQPLFNGAAAAFVLVVLFVPGAYASDALWGNSLLLPLVVANLALLIALRSGRLPFLLALSAAFLAHNLAAMHAPNDLFQTELAQLLPAYLVFFVGFVAPEEVTTPRDVRAQVAVGLAVGVLGVALRANGVGLPFAVALLVGNYMSCLVYQATRFRGVIVERLAWSRSPVARVPVPVFALRLGVGTTSVRSSKLDREEPAENAALLLGGPASLVEASDSTITTSRRAFLGTVGAAAGTVLLGGAAGRLAGVDPAILSLPAVPVLAGGRAIPRFKNVAAEAGIVLSHHGDPNSGSPAVGTGVAWGDYDNDGRPDLYVTDYMGASHLYRNNGDGTFTDVAEGAGVAYPGLHATSATFVDFDNDGRLDLYVGVAFGPNVLYRNNGDGTFTDVTRRSGLGDPGRTMSTAWADYDGDGYLDVFVANYPDEPVSFDANNTPAQNTRQVRYMPRPQNRLYHNNGDGTFSDVTAQLGLVPTRGFGFSAVWFDYNGDGRPDLYVAYDFGSVVQPNTLWRNDGPGGPNGWRFTQVEDQLGVATRANPMGVASGDYNNDGWLDLAVSNIGPNYLYRNESGRRFRDVAQQAHVSYHDQVIDNVMNPSMTWGTDFADFNNDGWLDLYIVAGTMDYEHVPQPNLLFLNNRGRGFIDVSAASGTNDPGQGRSVAVADYDGDGRLDMFVANYGQSPLLYRNVTADAEHRWLRLKLEGTQSNRDAVGARIALFVHGMAPQTREVQIGQGLGSCDDTVVHFGLGAATRADRVEIRWPSGTRQTLHRLQANRTLYVREPGPSRWHSRETRV